jgi:hypothetical protein
MQWLPITGVSQIMGPAPQLYDTAVSCDSRFLWFRILNVYLACFSARDFCFLCFSPGQSRLQ